MQSSCRYLREEALEVQVWATVLAGKPKESRPKAEDTLLGFAYIPLGEILSDKNEVYVRYEIAAVCKRIALWTCATPQIVKWDAIACA